MFAIEAHRPLLRRAAWCWHRVARSHAHSAGAPKWGMRLISGRLDALHPPPINEAVLRSRRAQRTACGTREPPCRPAGDQEPRRRKASRKRGHKTSASPADEGCQPLLIWCSASMPANASYSKMVRSCVCRSRSGPEREGQRECEGGDDGPRSPLRQDELLSDLDRRLRGRSCRRSCRHGRCRALRSPGRR